MCERLSVDRFELDETPRFKQKFLKNYKIVALVKQQMGLSHID